MNHNISKHVIAYETAAFCTIIVALWLDEVFDLPHLLFGAEATPINWRESLFESILTAIVAAVIIYFTKKLFQRITFLEGIVPICSFCKKIRDENGEWQQMETFISERTDAEFSHGICPDCAEEFYSRYASNFSPTPAPAGTPSHRKSHPESGR